VTSRTRTVLVAAVVGVVVVVTATSTAGATRARPLRAHQVQHLTLTLVDRSRTTDDPGGTRRAPSRTLRTEVYVPSGRGPFPLVLMAHGNNGDPAKLSELLTAWARAGYVVAAPAFPLTNDLSGGPSILGDYVHQPGDLSFVIDQLSAANRRGRSPLHGKVDTHHIGLAGHSLGGATALGEAFASCCRDRRLDALVVMDGRLAPFPHSHDVFRTLPMLVIHLRGDPVIPYSYAQQLYVAAKPPKYLMTLTVGIHFEPYENTPNVHDAAVTAATTAFWDAYLRHEPGAARRVVRVGTQHGLSRVYARFR
jgi:dienelactone hydrolase